MGPVTRREGGSSLKDIKRYVLYERDSIYLYTPGRNDLTLWLGLSNIYIGTYNE